jgi:hypothetical protein
MFLEVCEVYLRKHGIESPIVVELGIGRNRQKKFYEQLLGAQHIGIDKSNDLGIPDLLGDTHAPETIKALKEMLGGRQINILFIDASHRYEDVKRDFELYAPLCGDIIALHDTEAERRRDKDLLMEGLAEVWKFWDELKAKAYAGKEGYKDYLFLSIYQYRGWGKKGQYGIGVILKK